jgi:hypothetical protein
MQVPEQPPIRMTRVVTPLYLQDAGRVGFGSVLEEFRHPSARGRVLPAQDDG